MAFKHHTKITTAITSIMILIAIGTLSYPHLENWTYIKSFYFTVSTLTTVGYGDLTPTTPASQLFTAIFILLGVAIVLTALGTIGASYLSRRETRIKKQIQEKKSKKK